MMIALAIPIVLAALAVVFLIRARAEARRRDAQTWAELVARLEPGWNVEQLDECLDDQDCAPARRWEQFHGARGLYVMFRNAGVMLEMAEYAIRNGCGSVDRGLLAELRSDAMQIRVSVVLALTQYAFSQINERICANAQHATMTYQEMVSRMSGLLEVNGGQLAPAFVAAM